MEEQQTFKDYFKSIYGNGVEHARKNKREYKTPSVVVMASGAMEFKNMDRGATALLIMLDMEGRNELRVWSFQKLDAALQASVDMVGSKVLDLDKKRPQFKAYQTDIKRFYTACVDNGIEEQDGHGNSIVLELGTVAPFKNAPFMSEYLYSVDGVDEDNEDNEDNEEQQA